MLGLKITSISLNKTNTYILGHLWFSYCFIHHFYNNFFFFAISFLIFHWLWSPTLVGPWSQQGPQYDVRVINSTHTVNLWFQSRQRMGWEPREWAQHNRHAELMSSQLLTLERAHTHLPVTVKWTVLTTWWETQLA